jgi:hypothetical protein
MGTGKLTQEFPRKHMPTAAAARTEQRHSSAAATAPAHMATGLVDDDVSR